MFSEVISPSQYYLSEYHGSVQRIYGTVAVKVAHQQVFALVNSYDIFQYGGSVKCVERSVVVRVAGQVAEFAYHNDIFAGVVRSGYRSGTVSAYLYAALEAGR